MGIMRLVAISVRAAAVFVATWMSRIGSIVGVAVALAATPAVSEDMTIHMQMTPPQARAGDTVVFRLTLTNNSDEIIYGPGSLIGIAIRTPIILITNEDIDTCSDLSLGMPSESDIIAVYPSLLGMPAHSSCYKEFTAIISDHAVPEDFTSSFFSTSGYSVHLEQSSIRILGPAPTVASNSGSASGGYPVTLTGTNFIAGQTSVTFGGVPGTDVAVSSPTSLTVTTPPGTAGPVDLVVSTLDGGASAPAIFTYLAPGALSVTDGHGLSATGPFGGPFGPLSKTWTLENAGGMDIVVEVATTGTLFELTGANPGTPIDLSPGETHAVTATLNASTSGLAPGPHAGSVSFTNSTNGDGSTSRTVALEVSQLATSLVLSSSQNPSNAGEPVTFTATIAGGAAPSGNVTFSIDGTSIGMEALDAGSASLTHAGLTSGVHSVVASYSGDTNNQGSDSAPLLQQVVALGSVVIRQQTDGTDAVFGFSSATPDLNLVVATSGGSGESGPIELPAGSYSLTADDMSGAGFALTGLACSDTDSTTDLAGRTIGIMLDPGESLLCTFSSANSRETTTRLIENFLLTRAALILANQPDIQRRIDRLDGGGISGAAPVSALMGYLAGVAEGGPLTVSTSLGAIDRLRGSEPTNRFDLWFSGTFALYDAGGPAGDFSTASLGADYLVSSDLLAGVFVQADHLSQSTATDTASVSGTGWLAGPYATARLGQNLYLDILAAAGTSSNTVNPYGTYSDTFDATRWMLSTALQGEWHWENWTFGPRARLSYFEETSAAYTDSLGIDIPAITAGLGQIAVGPAISYRYVTEGEVVIDTSLRFEGIADLLNTSAGFALDDIHGRVEGTVGFAFPGGSSLGLSVAHDGIASHANATSARVTVSLPLQ